MKNFLKINPTQARSQSARLNFLAIFVTFLTLIIVFRLGYLQIYQYVRYHTLSLKNQMSVIPVPPTRGIILDRKGVVLAENIPIYALEIIPERVKNLPTSFKKLRKLLPSITEEDIQRFYQMRKQNQSFVPLPLKLKLSQEEVATFASKQYQFPGISIKAKLMRYYPLGEATAHLLGYVGHINAKELAEVNLSNYRGTNVIGKAGIEKFYEPFLHGKTGYQQVESDVSGRILQVIYKKNPISGEKLHLSLDASLQKISFEAMKNKRGAVVAIDPRNGEILAMVSTPSFDPNRFVTGMTSTEYQSLAKSVDKPLYNRAVRGLYPPASTIKPFIGLAGLQKGIIDERYSIYDPGWFSLPSVTRLYRDWKKTGHGTISLKRAIAVSCDTYFYQLGHKMGITAIEEMLVQFGFGHLTHVDLVEEAAGLVPSKRWKEQTKGSTWYPGDTVITAIGQGSMLASPLQLANATASLSLKGRRFRPHFLKASTPSDLEEIGEQKIVEEYPIQLKDKYHWQLVIEGMRAVIQSEEGTGRRFGRNAPYSVAAKTGTAQVVSGQQYEKVAYEAIPERVRDHSLFIAFAPVENPEISIAVIVENDLAASSIARKILDGYFDLAQNELKVSK